MYHRCIKYWPWKISLLSSNFKYGITCGIATKQSKTVKVSIMQDDVIMVLLSNKQKKNKRIFYFWVKGFFEFTRPEGVSVLIYMREGEMLLYMVSKLLYMENL
jgi:hypothetical protein